MTRGSVQLVLRRHVRIISGDRHRLAADVSHELLQQGWRGVLGGNEVASPLEP